MNLEAYLSVADAAALAGVSNEYMRQLVAGGKVRGSKIGGVWLVLKEDAAKFVRIPGHGRPKRARPKAKPAKKPGRRKP
jgi:excisionase family DNA binding protein